MNTLEICTKCGSKCCKSTPPALTSKDIEQIMNVVKNKDWITKKSDAFVIAKKQSSDDCYFLDETGKCAIYNQRPLDCRLFPLFVKIRALNEEQYELEWRIWYCPLTNNVGAETLFEEAKKLVLEIIKSDIKELFEYQSAMKKSGGYKKKHFLAKEKIIIKQK